MGPLPEGEEAPADGALPEGVTAAGSPFGLYLHVPFCTTRCGYCDFNTYTASELPGVSQNSYAGQLVGELELARRVVPEAPAVDTIFIGGGTPTLLPPADIALMLEASRDLFGLESGAEVTIEANPDSVTERSLEGLREAGVTRISFGMQSAAPHVLAVLERTHTAGAAQRAVSLARAAGFEHVSLDLIYGTPGESDDDWRRSVEAALSCDIDHLSAYALIVEEGTRFAAKVRRGEIPIPDDDAMADRYLMVDELATSAGMSWYEVSNWAGAGGQCRHNLAYWRGTNWWGAGPGAHSHIGGVRWWNRKHPASWAAALAAGQSPAQGREVLTAADQHVERVMLGIRLAEGLLEEELSAGERLRLDALVARGWTTVQRGRIQLTTQGRLMADAVVRELLD